MADYFVGELIIQNRVFGTAVQSLAINRGEVCFFLLREMNLFGFRLLPVLVQYIKYFLYHTANIIDCKTPTFLPFAALFSLY